MPALMCGSLCGRALVAEPLLAVCASGAPWRHSRIARQQQEVLVDASIGHDLYVLH